MKTAIRLPPFRVGILGLMGVVLACGVWFFWLSRPTFHGASLAFTAALTVILFATLAAIYGSYRTFWVGFAVFGWVYLALAFAPGAGTDIRPYLVTSHLLGDLANLLGLSSNGLELHGNSPFLTIGDAWIPTDSGIDAWLRTDKGRRFQRVGHSLAAILHAFAGGLLAVFLARRTRRSAMSGGANSDPQIEGRPQVIEP
jgi:hypothetical protein